MLNKRGVCEARIEAQASRIAFGCDTRQGGHGDPLGSRPCSELHAMSHQVRLDSATAKLGQDTRSNKAGLLVQGLQQASSNRGAIPERQEGRTAWVLDHAPGYLCHASGALVVVFHETGG